MQTVTALPAKLSIPFPKNSIPKTNGKVSNELNRVSTASSADPGRTQEKGERNKSGEQSNLKAPPAQGR